LRSRNRVRAVSAIGSVAVEPQTDEKGERHNWLDLHVVAKLKSLRGPGESYSEVILRLAVCERPDR